MSWRTRLILAAVLVGMGGLGWVFYSTRLIQVLVVGTDEIDYSRHGDTMMLLTFRPAAKRLHVLSIPRDTMVEGPEHQTMKMGELFAHGWGHGGADSATRLVLEQLSRVLDLPVRHFCVVEYKGFERAVDELGGVDVMIPHEMKYDDEAADLHIHLPAGSRRLSGKEALQFVRYRGDKLGDVGRISRQQQFLRAVKNRLELSRVPSIVRIVLRHVKTNLRTAQMLRLARQVSGWKEVELETATLPGELTRQNRISYWQPDPNGMKVLRERLMNL